MPLMYFGDCLPYLGWLPIWINDSLFFLMNEWMPMEFWNEDTQEFKTRPLVIRDK